MISKEYKCPKCGAPIEDWWLGEEDVFMGEFDGDRFRCMGHYTGKFKGVSEHCSINRTRSCGYFSLEDLTGENHA